MCVFFTRAKPNRSALCWQGEDRLECELPDGTPWSQPSYPYAAKCLRWLREDYAALPEEARGTVDAALAGSGAEASCATSALWLCFAENRVRWQVLFGEIGGWPNPGMGSAVASGDWSPTMGEARM